jgi:hypothetical protein
MRCTRSANCVPGEQVAVGRGQRPDGQRKPTRRDADDARLSRSHGYAR